MAEKKYKEEKLEKGEAQGLFDLWNAGMTPPKKKPASKPAGKPKSAAVKKPGKK